MLLNVMGSNCSVVMVGIELKSRSSIEQSSRSSPSEYNLDKTEEDATEGDEVRSDVMCSLLWSFGAALRTPNKPMMILIKITEKLE